MARILCNGEVMDVENLVEIAHKCAVDHGFWDTERSFEHSMALVKSEIGEAIGAAQKENWKGYQTDEFMKKFQSVMPGSDEFVELYKKEIKGCVEEEMADVIIRAFDLIGAMKFPVERKQPYISLWDYKTFRSYDSNPSFTETAYLAFLITDVVDLAYFMIDWATEIGVDIEWYVQKKIEYNKTRPYLHGKAF